jgi:hypothetical protein
MDSGETEAFARTLMHEVWEAFDPEAVPKFYHREVIGHHRGQTLGFADILNRLAWDQHHNVAPISTSGTLWLRKIALQYVSSTLQRREKREMIFMPK